MTIWQFEIGDFHFSVIFHSGGATGRHDALTPWRRLSSKPVRVCSSHPRAPIVLASHDVDGFPSYACRRSVTDRAVCAIDTATWDCPSFPSEGGAGRSSGACPPGCHLHNCWVRAFTRNIQMRNVSQDRHTATVAALLSTYVNVYSAPSPKPTELANSSAFTPITRNANDEHTFEHVDGDYECIVCLTVKGRECDLR